MERLVSCLLDLLEYLGNPGGLTASIDQDSDTKRSAPIG